jgi:hypothetical protein
VSGDERRRPVAGLRQLSRDTTPFGGDVPPDIARDAIWVEPRMAGLVDHTGFTADGRLRLPHWRGTAAVGSEAIPWARRDDPPSFDERPAARPFAGDDTPRSIPAPDQDPTATREALDGDRAPDPVSAPSGGPAGATTTSPTEPSADTAPGPTDAPVEARRLEQHFVYNSLNAIASLIRTDPARARELLVGFADLSRATDRPAGTPSSLGHELATVGDYLALEQARFGKRLQVEIAVDPALHATPVQPLLLLTAVRDAVQRDIEPSARGGVLTVTAQRSEGGCVVTVLGGAGEPRLLDLTAHATV